MTKAPKGKSQSSAAGFHDLGNRTLAGDRQTAAIKRVLATQLERAMKARNLTKLEMARRMKTSRVQLDRLLDPANDSVTLATLGKAAAVVGCQVRLELV